VRNDPTNFLALPQFANPEYIARFQATSGRAPAS